MRNIRSSRRERMRVNAEINFTNLIDVAFVLLIIFMITAPIMQGGIELDLPDAEATPLTTSETVVVSVGSDGRIYIGEVEVSETELRQTMPMYMADHQGEPIMVKGDNAASYGSVLRVMGILNALGYTSINLAADPVREG
ncbi:MAG TPA: biopolymer transporter ExbD [Longimicrobiales bacterium]|jgi:biopolymer transport protein ExbD|nr:biopolymer transporter ExbD [Longimicrobiales bacterium]